MRRAAEFRIRFFQETLGLTPRDQFGSSENGLPLGNFNALDVETKPGSMGLPMPGFAMSVIDEDGIELPAGAVGYLAQRPSEQGYYALGYWKDPERTRQLFRRGWITAGDLARRDKAGYFWFEGRADDVDGGSLHRTAGKNGGNDKEASTSFPWIESYQAASSSLYDQV